MRRSVGGSVGLGGSLSAGGRGLGIVADDGRDSGRFRGCGRRRVAPLPRVTRHAPRGPLDGESPHLSFVEFDPDADLFTVAA